MFKLRQSIAYGVMGLGSLELIYFGALKKYPSYSYKFKGVPIKK